MSCRKNIVKISVLDPLNILNSSSSGLSVQSSELGPLTLFLNRKRVLLPPPFGSNEGDATRLRVRGPNSDEGTLWYSYVFYNPLYASPQTTPLPPSPLYSRVSFLYTLLLGDILI